MARNRKSAKTAGTRFERTTADYLKAMTGQPIDRLVKTGAKDRGDVGPLTNAKGDLVAVELQRHRGTSAAPVGAGSPCGSRKLRRRRRHRHTQTPRNHKTR